MDRSTQARACVCVKEPSMASTRARTCRLMMQDVMQCPNTYFMCLVRGWTGPDAEPMAEKDVAGSWLKHAERPRLSWLLSQETTSQGCQLLPGASNIVPFWAAAQ